MDFTLVIGMNSRTGERVSDSILRDMQRDVDSLKLEFAKMSVREEQTQVALSQINMAMEKMAATLEEFTQYQSQYGSDLAIIAKHSEKLVVAAEAMRDVEGAARTGFRVRRFGVWILGVPVVGTSLYALFSWLIDHIP